MVRSPEELLRRHGIDYVRTAKNNYTTNCPQCSEGYLNVKVDNKGVAFYCHRCEFKGGEQFEPRSGNKPRSTERPFEPRSKDKPRSTGRKGCRDYDLGPIKEIFDYRDETGKLLFQALRYEPIGRPKEFLQRTSPDHWGIKGVRIVPFRLRELLQDIHAGNLIFILEGEKDVNTVRSHGLAATCNPMGAGKWWPEFNKILSGADVILCGTMTSPAAIT
jgi:hypothetical protein